MRQALTAAFMLFTAALAWADTETDQAPVDAPRMDNQRLQTLIEGVASGVEGRPGLWQFTLHGFETTVITDEKADRMRIIVPVATVEEVDAGRLLRLMQANFDSALDARYSIAKGVLWSAFIHPLSELSDHQFIDGLAQTVNLAATYGSSYSSGALIFGGGDGKQEQDKLYRDIMEREGSI